MTLDELAKHGLRVKPDASMNKWYADIIALQIAAALEPITPPDVAQAARVVAQGEAAP